MNRFLALLTLGVMSVVPAPSQEKNAAPSSPVIVAQVALINQTASLGSGSSPIVLFTPGHNGLYRVTTLVQLVPPQTACSPPGCDLANIYYTQSGLSSEVISGSFGHTDVVQGQTGMPFVYWVRQAYPSEYSLYIVVEQLEASN